MKLTEIQDLIDELTERFELGFHIRFIRNNRLTRLGGRANYTRQAIEMPAWMIASTEAEQTVRHEFAHFLAQHRYGKVQSHGTEWKECCILVGARPETYYDEAAVRETKVSHGILHEAVCEKCGWRVTRKKKFDWRWEQQLFTHNRCGGKFKILS